MQFLGKRMPIVSYDIVKEVQGAAYGLLVRAAESFCDSAVLVIRDLPKYQPTVTQVLAGLEPYLVGKNENGLAALTATNGGANVCRYRLSPQCVWILECSAEGLYDWCLPTLPEHLCFLRPDGTPWLVSNAGDQCGHLRLSEDEFASLTRAVPGIEEYLGSGVLLPGGP